MLKTKHKVGLALLATFATALSACGSKKTDDGNDDPNGKVIFWSSFGSNYTSVLQGVVDNVSDSISVEIEHKEQGSYDEINRNMISAIAVGDYPNLAIGYPDHFASYLGSDVLKPLNDYFTQDEFNDYYEQYMDENQFYDNGKSKAQLKTYGVPFNKSTELLGYNGCFVDYANYIDPSIGGIPRTWGEYETKAPKYYAVFSSLFGKYLYGKQDVFGTASDFAVYPYVTDEDPPGTKVDGEWYDADGRVLLIDCSKVNKDNSYLMSWDATDNAFITLVRQWGAKYTEVPESEKVKIAKKRVGNVYFNSADNQDTVVSMLKYFRQLHKDKLFGTPQTLGGDYSSKAFEQSRVMFMICSSGGLSYNTANWRHRFRVSPILYKDADKKTVISQGANLCMTKRSNFTNSIKVMKALTTGKFQTDWCLATGYYPCSKSAAESKAYQDFVNEAKGLTPEQAEEYGVYENPVRVAYREGSVLNSVYYMDQYDDDAVSEKWTKFVDPAFEGSSVLRQAVKGVLDSIFKIADADINNSQKYKDKLNEIKEAPTVIGQSTIHFVD